MHFSLLGKIHASQTHTLLGKIQLYLGLMRLGRSRPPLLHPPARKRRSQTTTTTQSTPITKEEARKPTEMLWHVAAAASSSAIDGPDFARTADTENPLAADSGTVDGLGFAAVACHVRIMGVVVIACRTTAAGGGIEYNLWISSEGRKVSAFSPKAPNHKFDFCCHVLRSAATQ